MLVMVCGVAMTGYVTSSITALMAIRSAAYRGTLSKKQLVADILKARKVCDICSYLFSVMPTLWNKPLLIALGQVFILTVGQQ
jgi:hypothetical protein